MIDLAKAKSAELGRTIGIYPETKHPSYFAAVAQANGVQRMEDRLVSILHYDGMPIPGECVIQGIVIIFKKRPIQKLFIQKSKKSNYIIS